MSRRISRRALVWWLGSLTALSVGSACGSSSGSGGTTERGFTGDPCRSAADCTSGVCAGKECMGNGQGAPSGSDCTSSRDCASGRCTASTCAVGDDLDDGMSCAAATECKSLACTDGICGKDGLPPSTGSSAFGGSPGTSSSGAGGHGGWTNATAISPPFPGLGSDWHPLSTGCGPDTATQCGSCAGSDSDDTSIIRPPALLCFDASADGDMVDPTPEDPAAIIEQVIETSGGVSYVHIRVTFDPSFADNTYGANASAGWLNGEKAKGHTFKDLTGSDHLDLLLTNGNGETVIELGEDYIHSLTDEGPKPGGPKAGPGEKTGTGGSSGNGCGYATLGVRGGEGEMLSGDASSVLAVSTSIDRNLNACGYCSNAACTAGDTGEGEGDCTVNSPATDESYTQNVLTPGWNYAVVYEVWIDLDAFGSAGFGQAYVTYVHASPSKLADNTLYVDPTPCPPGWGPCPDGQDCTFAPPTNTGGAGGGGGLGGSGGTSSGCDPNYQIYITLEGEQECTPIPYAGYPDRAPCPDGYVLDISSEGQYCVIQS